MNDVNYISDKPALDSMCLQLQDCDWLAIDTEFIREKTYFPQLALLQISNEKLIYCIDPVAIDDLSPLFELLENTAITKVFHSASQDLEIFFHLRNCLPMPLFDTQIAAALLGLGEQIGYAPLVSTLLNIELDKSHTRTDWMQRPLSREQIRYAADDVLYLSQIYPILLKKLEKLQRLDWIENEQIRLQNPLSYQPDPPGCWQRIKGSGKLKRQQLNVLKHLAAWRERQAIQYDRPRRWITSDGALLNLAIQQPSEHEQLLHIRQLESKVAERNGDELLKLVAQALSESEENWPEETHPNKPSVQEDATVDLMMAVVRLCADQHQLSPGQITSRSELLKLLRGELNLPIMNGWRRQVAGQAILDTYEGKLRLVCEHGNTALQSS